MALPANWGSLRPAQQLYVATNLERTAAACPRCRRWRPRLTTPPPTREPPTSAMPTPPAGFPWTEVGEQLGRDLGNPLEAIYFWMYDDGPGSSNISCPPSGGGGCWQHRAPGPRRLRLHPVRDGRGVGVTGRRHQHHRAAARHLGVPAIDFTWAQEAPYLR